MAKRICVVGYIAILGAGLMLASDVSARSGGHGGPRMAPASGLQAQVGKTIAHPRAMHAFQGAAARLNHRGRFGLPLTGWWGSGWYGGYYDPSNYVMLHDRPAYAEPPPAPSLYSGGPYPAPFAEPAPKIIQVIVHRPGCASDTQTIVGADGKDRAITMMRC